MCFITTAWLVAHAQYCLEITPHTSAMVCTYSCVMHTPSQYTHTIHPHNTPTQYTHTQYTHTQERELAKHRFGDGSGMAEETTFEPEEEVQQAEAKVRGDAMANNTIMRLLWWNHAPDDFTLISIMLVSSIVAYYVYHRPKQQHRKQKQVQARALHQSRLRQSKLPLPMHPPWR